MKHYTYTIKSWNIDFNRFHYITRQKLLDRPNSLHNLLHFKINNFWLDNPMFHFDCLFNSFLLQFDIIWHWDRLACRFRHENRIFNYFAYLFDNLNWHLNKVRIFFYFLNINLFGDRLWNGHKFLLDNGHRIDHIFRLIRVNNK